MVELLIFCLDKLENERVKRRRGTKKKTKKNLRRGNIILYA